MLDLAEIEDTINELENQPTTLDNCRILADLYICKANNEKAVYEQNTTLKDDVENELNDILPTYRNYVDAKRRYQLHELNVDVPIKYMKDVCKEIKEFIQVLYSGTSTIDEREAISKMISDLKEVF